jgi:hypothetical protein
MLRGVRGHLTFANCVSVIALFIALGGAGYAAMRPPKNSVGSAQIKKAAITGVKIKDGSIGSADLSPAVRAQLDKAGTPGAVGSQGPPGPQGTAGSMGTNGAPGSNAASIVFGNSDFALPASAGSSVQFAPSGYTHDPSADLSSLAFEQVTPTVDVVVRDLIARFQGAPGAGHNRSVTLFVNDAATLSCTVAGSDTVCDTGSATAMVPPKSVLKIRELNGPAGAGPSTGVSWSFRTTPT